MFIVNCIINNQVCCCCGYKTKRSATNRYNKAVESNCYDKVELVEDNTSENIFAYALDHGHETEQQKTEYKIVDNYHEKILPESYESEQAADQAIKDFISGHNERNENFDYNIIEAEQATSYKELIEQAESN